MAAKNERKKSFAFALYMQGDIQQVILKKVGIGSSRTLNKWIKDGGWKEQRTQQTITRPSLVNKILTATANYIEDCLANEKEVDADRLSKFASTIEKLDKKESPYEAMNVFMRFGQWMLRNKEDLDMVKHITKLQDQYLKDYFMDSND